MDLMAESALRNRLIYNVLGSLDLPAILFGQVSVYVYYL